MRTVTPAFREAIERPNPQVGLGCDILAPDVSKVLRGVAGDWTTAVGSGGALLDTPGWVTQDDGTLGLVGTASTMASFAARAGSTEDATPIDPTRFYRGVLWTPSASVGRRKLRTVRAYVEDLASTYSNFHRWRLQVYVIPALPASGQVSPPDGGTVYPRGSYAPTPLFAEPIIVETKGTGGWTSHGARFGRWITFDATRLNVYIGQAQDAAGLAVSSSPRLLFVLWEDGGRGYWSLDTATTRATAVGDWQYVAIRKQGTSPYVTTAEKWALTQASSYTGMLEVDVTGYAASSNTARYVVSPSSAPKNTSQGRVVFERIQPTGSAMALEVSTAGSSGPWTVVQHGDPVPVSASVHLRLSMSNAATVYESPRVVAMGVEYHERFNVTADATVTPPAPSVSVPFSQASVGDGRIKLVRSGATDYEDFARRITSAYPTTKLEAHLWMGGTALAAADRLTIARAMLATRQPGATSETLTLLSRNRTLRRPVPTRTETVNQRYTVQAGSTVSVIKVIGLTNTPYLGLGYTLRYVSAANATVPAQNGLTFRILSNTGTTDINLEALDTLPFAPAVGDIVEVHSNQWTRSPLQWVAADPADIWWDILTTHLKVPTAQLGAAGLGPRNGLPPRVTDIAPGDTATQDKLRVTLKVTEEDGSWADELLDQLSFLMGGVTTDIDGQIVFRQLYPLRDATGAITVPVAAPTEVFGPVNTKDLQTTVRVENRMPVVQCTYGVNTLLPEPNAPMTLAVADGDAVEWLGLDDMEVGSGVKEVPDSIARWCYNGIDQGRMLAERLCRQVVTPFSTGVREWQWTSTDPKPWLTVGDTVVVVTDQYSDYDPRTKQAVVGTRGYLVVLTSVGEGGRSFRGFVPSLNQPELPTNDATGVFTPPSVAVDFVGILQPTVTINGPAGATSAKVNIRTDRFPTSAEVDAAGGAYTLSGPSGSLLLPDEYTLGQTLYVGVKSYGAAGAAAMTTVLTTVYITFNSGSGSGGLGGAGTANRLARWVDAVTLATGTIEDDGTHAFPVTDAASDFGTAARRWRDGRFSRDVYAGGSLWINGVNSYRLSVLAANATDADIFLAGMTGVTNGLTYRRVAGAFELRLTDGIFVPGNDAAQDFGSSSLRWRDAWIQRSLYAGSEVRAGLGSGVGFAALISGTSSNSGYIHFYRPSGTRVGYIGFASETGGPDAGVIPYVAGAHEFTGTVQPNADNVRDFGLSNYRWRDGHFSRDVYAQTVRLPAGGMVQWSGSNDRYLTPEDNVFGGRWQHPSRARVVINGTAVADFRQVGTQWSGVQHMAGVRHAVLEYTYNDTTPAGGIEIRTNIPFTSGTGMCTIIVEGYPFSAAVPELWAVSFYPFDGGSGMYFVSVGGSSWGGRLPTVRLGAVGGLVRLYLEDTIYYRRFWVRAFGSGMSEAPAWFEGWTYTHTTAASAGAAAVVTVPFYSQLGQTLIGGSLDVTGTAAPSVHSLYDLGTTARRWRDLYLSNTLVAGGRITGGNGLRLTSGGFQRPDDAGLALLLGNGTNLHYAVTHQFRDAAGSGWGDVNMGPLNVRGTGAALYARDRDDDAYAAALYRQAGISRLWHSDSGGANDVIQYTRSGVAIFTPLTVHGTMHAGTHNTYDIGATAVRWRDLWLSRDAAVNGALTAGSAAISTTLTKRTRTVPSVVISATAPTGTFDVGDLWIQP